MIETTELTNSREFKIDIFSFARIALAAIAWSAYAVHFHSSLNGEIVQLTFGALFYALSLSLLVGWRSQLSALLLGIYLIFCKYYDGVAPLAAHSILIHHYTNLLGLMLCILSLAPCGKYFSLDRIQNRAPIGDGTLWFMPLFRALLSSIYLFAAIGKMTSGSLSGAHFLVIAMNVHLGSLSIPNWLQPLLMVCTWLIILLELVLAIAPWNRKLSRWFFPVAILFHLSIYYMLVVEVFSITMILLWIIVMIPEINDGFFKTKLGGSLES